jgi:hypothetical protein
MLATLPMPTRRIPDDDQAGATRSCPADHREKAERIAEALDWSFLCQERARDLRLSATSCYALPGTVEKQQVMILRVRRGFLPCHPSDARWDDLFRLAFKSPVGANGRIGEHTIIIDGQAFRWSVAITLLDTQPGEKDAVLQMAYAALDRVKLEGRPA